MVLSRTSPLVLALDIGTSSVRASLWTEDGQELPSHRSQRRWRPRGDEPKASEIDPRTLLRETSYCIDDVLTTAGKRAGCIAAVGACCFWHSLVGVGESGDAVTPVITWADARPGRMLDALRSRSDTQRLTHRTGCPIHASYFPAKLLWLVETDPKACALARWWLSPADWLWRQWTGQIGMSISTASATGLWDRFTGQWNREASAAAGCDSVCLPPVRELADSPRGLVERWAKRWPALADVPWVWPIGDGAAGNVGSGCVAEGLAALNVGTSAAVRMGVARQPKRIPQGLWCYRITKGRPLVGGAVSNGGSVYDWLGRTLKLGRNADAKIAAVAPDAHGLTVLPELAGARTPQWRADATGAVVGLTGATTPAQFARAMTEAAAIRIATMVRLIDRAAGAPVRLIGSGGALASSTLWAQMIADAAGRTVELPEATEASMRGAALLAAEAAGLKPLPTDPPKIVHRIEPNTQNTDIYRAEAKRMDRLWRALMDDRT